MDGWWYCIFLKMGDWVGVLPRLVIEEWTRFPGVRRDDGRGCGYGHMLDTAEVGRIYFWG